MQKLTKYSPSWLVGLHPESHSVFLFISMDIQKALIVKKEWLDKIFDDDKIWEMRTTKTKIRGKIGLIESGTGMIVGECELLGCLPEPISKKPNLKEFHKIDNLNLLDKWKYAWVLGGAKRYNKPIPYKHPQGAVIWEIYRVMKANELRIGNLVNQEGKPVKVGIAVLSYLNTLNLVAGVESIIKPIPLTEELLIKLGYFQEYFDDWNHNDNASPCIQEYGGKYNYCIEDVPAKHRPIEYVHQLQNLHFVLTGKELTITF